MIFKMKGWSPFTKSNGDDKHDIVIHYDDDGNMVTPEKKQDVINNNSDDDCPTGTCPPPKPEWGTKEHRDLESKNFHSFKLRRDPKIK